MEGSQEMKKRGNDLFKQKDYEGAVEAYTKAIQFCPEGEANHLSLCYQNRAAANERLVSDLLFITLSTAYFRIIFADVLGQFRKSH